MINENCIGPEFLYHEKLIGPDFVFPVFILSFFPRCILSAFSPGFLLDFEGDGDIERKVAAGTLVPSRVT